MAFNYLNTFANDIAYPFTDAVLVGSEVHASFYGTGANGGIRVYDLTGNYLRQYGGSRGICALSYDGTRVWALDSYHNVYLGFNPANGNPDYILNCVSGGVGIAKEPGTNKVWITTASYSVYVYDITKDPSQGTITATKIWDPNSGAWTDTMFPSPSKLAFYGGKLYIHDPGLTGISVHNPDGSFVTRVGVYLGSYNPSSPPAEANNDFLSPDFVSIANGYVFSGNAPDGPSTGWLMRCPLDNSTRDWPYDAHMAGPAWVLGMPDGSYLVGNSGTQGGETNYRIDHYGEPMPPVASAVLSQVDRTVTAVDTSTDPDGDLASVSISWGDGTATDTAFMGQVRDHTYPVTSATYTITVTATDAAAHTHSATYSVTVTLNTPAASATFSQNYRTVTIRDTSTDADGPGDIASISVAWGDGQTSTTTRGGTVSHTYAKTTASYTITLTATDYTGLTDTWTHAVTVDVVSGSFNLAQDPEIGLVICDASTVHIPAGYSVTSYRWDYGDGSPAEYGEVGTHYYETQGTYTITLSVTLSGGVTETITEEVSIMQITKILPLTAITGTTVTITGSGFGTSAGTVKMGATTITSPTWSDTSITFPVPGAVTPGTYDIIVTQGASTITAEGAVTVYDPNNVEALAQVTTGKMKRVYVDGKHIGFTEQDFGVEPTADKLAYQPNSRSGPVKTFFTAQTLSIAFTISQINGANLALALGGTWDETTKIVTLARTDAPTTHSIMAVDAVGITYVLPRCQLANPARLTLSATATNNLPVTFDAQLVDDGSGVERFGYIQMPA